MPTADLREVIFINHPNLIFPSIATVSAYFALSPTPSFIPLTVLVATVLIHTRIAYPRPHAARVIFGEIAGISLASTLSHLTPSIHALSSTASSIFSLWLISSLSSAVAFGAIVISDRVSLRVSNPSTKLTLFPTFWATVWQTVSHTSPVGHLVTWSPVAGIANYEWMRPFFGAWGINWLVGAWAMVIAEIVGAWFIGPEDEFEPQGPLIPSIVSNGDSQPTPPTSSPGPHRTLLLTTVLLVLTSPSLFSPATPLLPWSSSSTPLPVGCILPHPPSSGDGSTPLDRFIAESRHHNGARVLLWPEGALRFETVSQREEAINRVRNEVKGPLVGVTFTEPVPASAGWEHSREGKWRNGLVLVGPDGPVAEYYKRNLVPSTCSNTEIIFALTIAFTSQLQSLTRSLNLKTYPRYISLNSMGPTRTRNGLQFPHTSAPSPSRQPFVWISRAQPYLLRWNPVRHSSWHPHKPGTTTSVWQCGSKPGPAPRKREAWCCSVMVVLKARVGSPAMAYESLSSSELVLGHALSAFNGHSISAVRYTCGAASTSQLVLCGCWWVVVRWSKFLSGTDLFVASVGPQPSHLPAWEKLLVERGHFSGAPQLFNLKGKINPC